MTKERLHKVRAVLARRQVDLTVIMDGVHKSHNVAAIVRSCEAVGVQDVHMAEPRCGFGTHHGTSQGSQKWVTGHKYKSCVEPIERMKEQGFQILAANFSEKAVVYHEVDYTKPTAILMGTELYGVSEEGLNLVDQDVYIPMMGMVESFNVSVACAILLAEAQRQRILAGMYELPQLEEERMNSLCFEWMQPKMARYYQQKGMSYPELDEEGDIVFDT